MRTDYEEALLRVSDTLRRHNKPAGGISSKTAVKLILDAVQPRAEWRWSPDDILPHCTACGERWAQTRRLAHCPSCGAKMKERNT